MIMTLEELRQLVQTDETDEVLTLRLEAYEQTIKGFTHNDFGKYMVDGVIVWPADVKMGVVNLLKWETDNRDRVGVASETISRHSVTYSDPMAGETLAGYPAALMGFLRPYMRARFGQVGSE